MMYAQVSPDLGQHLHVALQVSRGDRHEVVVPVISYIRVTPLQFTRYRKDSYDRLKVYSIIYIP